MFTESNLYILATNFLISRKVSFNVLKIYVCFRKKYPPNIEEKPKYRIGNL